ncbi:MAG: hypothetical protein R2795_03445 [Saprospiraceae bacterium]
MKYWLLSLFLLGTLLQAQNVMPIGSWRTHLPKRVGRSVTQSDDQIFYTTRALLAIMDKDEIAPRFLGTPDGLSGVAFDIIRYHQPTGTLVIVYQDGVIDLYKDGKITTLNSIRNFTSITGEKG